MNLEAYRLAQRHLDAGELASVNAAYSRLKFSHGENFPNTLAELARVDETAYHTQNRLNSS